MELDVQLYVCFHKQTYLSLSVCVCVCVGGETIKNINQQSGAHVELQRNPPPSTDPNTRVFTIRGTAQQMDLARQLIDDKIGVRQREFY